MTRLRVVSGQGSDSDFLSDCRPRGGLTHDSDGPVPLGDLSPPRTLANGLDLIGAWM